MRNFVTGREAKEYLIEKIVAEAQSESVPLSDVERKMMYFSEIYWTLPEIFEVNDAFDRDYDPDEYEEKIAALVKKLRARIRANNADDFKDWSEAVRVLGKEDHYLLVMIAAGS